MTAINVFRLANSVHMMTDGGVWAPDGKFVGVINKAFCFPHLSAAFAMRGPAALMMPITLLLSSAGQSYEALRMNIVDTCRKIWEMPFAADVRKESGFAKADFVVAGISDGGPHGYSFHSEPDGDLPSWTQREIEQLYISPGKLEICNAVFGTGMEMAKFDVVKHGLEIMEMQRRQPEGGVGGFAQLTTITAYGGITTRILRRWADGN